MKRSFPGSFPVVLALILFSALAVAAEPERLFQEAFSFGLATQTDGEVLVIGAPDEAIDGNSAQGAAYVYEFREGAWQEVARLTASDGDALDRFGSAIAVDENVILVGAPDAPVGTLPEAGAVYVFERSAEGAWTRTAKVVANDPATMAMFGARLALDGERMVVAAPGAPGELEAYVGAAYVFDRHAGAPSWQQTARLTRGDRFATDVDVSGDRVAIATGNEQGFVYTYRHDGSGWAFELPVQPAAGNDNKVALENDVLAVGTPDDVLVDRPWSNVGAVHVFERDAVAWQHVAEFHPEFPGPLDMFGDYVDMNDGLIAAAGSGENAGGVSLIRKNETGEWVQAFPGLGVVEFGGSLAVSARALAAGGPSGEGGNIYVLSMVELLSRDASEPPADDDSDTIGSGIGAVENDDDAANDGTADDSLEEVDDSFGDVDAIEDDSDAGSIIDATDNDGLDADAIEDDSDAGNIVDTVGEDTVTDDGGSGSEDVGDTASGNSVNVALPDRSVEDRGGGSAGWLFGLLVAVGFLFRRGEIL